MPLDRLSPPWWRGATVYQVYPRSFSDSDGDGIGDLAGITERLDQLAWLGVDALWISPFFPSPMRDFGYDVSDYCDVDPRFGSLEGFDRLLSAAHGVGLRVLVDWVPNHSSSEHPWFLESRSSRDSPKRNWYVWRDPGPGGSPPNNWLAALTGGGPAWTFDEATGQYWLHLYLPAQPDLNWEEPAVVEAMHDVLRFWLDRGVDGFRMDVIHCLGKPDGLPDDPAELVAAGVPHVPTNDVPRTHELLRGIRAVLDGYQGDRVSVGEVYLLSTARVATYYGHGDELHLAFNFPPLFAPWTAAAWRRRIERVHEELDPVDAWPTWVLSNHDNPRHRSRYGGSESRARAAAVLLLGLRGTPFLYQGEELGLLDAEVSAAEAVDPGGRDGSRAPIPWDAPAPHGWGAAPWLPFPPEASARSWAALREDQGSILHLYRRLLIARRTSPALRTGDERLLQGLPDDVVGWERADEATGDRRTVLVHFGPEPVLVDVAGAPLVEVHSHGRGEGAPFGGRLDPDSAVVLGA